MMAIHSTQSVLGRIKGPVNRVVSLVPSMTQSMLDLGLANHLVGVTDYCPAEAATLESVQRCGGPKNPEVERILHLQPDLILANQEENSREHLLNLDQAGLQIWMSFPVSVDTAMEELWVFGRLFQLETKGQQQLDQLSIALEWTQRAAANRPPQRYCCPIWQEQDANHGLWWMTFNQSTYASDVLKQCGGVNVFAERERRYPVEADLGLAQAVHRPQADVRYPRVTMQDVLDSDPELIFLPSEPYSFSMEDLQQTKLLLQGTTAVRSSRVHQIDGRLITWHGTTLARAMAELPAFFAP